MIIDGKKISQEVLTQIKNEVGLLKFKPKLIDVLIGADPVTESYVRIKAKRAAEVGIDFEIVRLEAGIEQAEVEIKISELNETEDLSGLIVQLPLPAHLDKQSILDCIDPNLDVDVITSINLGRLFTGKEVFAPATAGAIFRILDYQKIDLKGKNLLIIGAGDLVGKPSAFMAIQRGATVTIANRATKNLSELTLMADVIISGAGQPGLITSEMVRASTVVIDAGTAESAGEIAGDADFINLKSKVAGITPVPGGVGPVTVAMLLSNVLESAKNR